MNPITDPITDPIIKPPLRKPDNYNSSFLQCAAETNRPIYAIEHFVQFQYSDEQVWLINYYLTIDGALKRLDICKRNNQAANFYKYSAEELKQYINHETT